MFFAMHKYALKYVCTTVCSISIKTLIKCDFIFASQMLKTYVFFYLYFILTGLLKKLSKVHELLPKYLQTEILWGQVV